MTKIIYLSTINILLALLIFSFVFKPASPPIPNSTNSQKQTHPLTINLNQPYEDKSFYVEYGADTPTRFSTYTNQEQSVVFKDGTKIKTIYSIPRESLEWGNEISSIKASRDGKYVFFIETGYEWQIYHLYNVETGVDLNKQSQLQGDIEFIDDKFIVFSTYKNDFSGESITGLFVTEYGNRDNLKPVLTIATFGSEITLINASDPLVTFITKDYPCEPTSAQCDPIFSLYQYNAQTEKLTKL